MNNSENDPWPGTVTVNNETFQIQEGRLSFTPKEDFYLLNVWIKAEDCESQNNVFPPMIEIRSKTKVNLRETNSLQLEMPSVQEAGDEWEDNYYTGYYDGMHQSFADVKIEISRSEENLFLVEFSGVPEMYSSAKGSCQLTLKNELIMYW